MSVLDFQVIEARRRGSRLALAEASLLPRGPVRDRLERAARLELLEAEQLAECARSKREAREHFERLYGPAFVRAGEVERRHLLAAFNNTIEHHRCLGPIEIVKIDPDAA